MFQKPFIKKRFFFKCSEKKIFSITFCQCADNNFPKLFSTLDDIQSRPNITLLFGTVSAIKFTSQLSPAWPSILTTDPVLDPLISLVIKDFSCWGFRRILQTSSTDSISSVGQCPSGKDLPPCHMAIN